MKILFLTFYFEPDLCAGSFRNTSLFNELIKQLNQNDTVDVITTHPNRYKSYKAVAKDRELRGDNVVINRIKIPEHNSGLKGQIKSFNVFFKQSLKIAKKNNYDLVYASSSRLFTAYLGAKIAKKNKAKLYLDIRDIFRESIVEIFNSKSTKKSLNIFLKPIEKKTFGRANHINLVSKGFLSYFEKYKNASLSFYTNGIDDIFIKSAKCTKEVVEKKVKTIVYAGNIGEGQGLDIIIPIAAKKLSNKYKFIIFGDGGAKKKLLNKVEQLSLTNVEFRKPVSRDLLIEEYNNADFLFLHLNKFKAFERVLPSKLFEYGAFNKPIIAGVGGYAYDFLKEEMENIILFKPGDVDSFIKQMNNFEYKTSYRKDFINNHNRDFINKKMVQSILSI